MHHHRIIPVISVGVSLLLSSCSWFSPLGRAIDQWESEDNMTVVITSLFNAQRYTTKVEVDGHLIKSQTGYDAYILDLNFEEEEADVYIRSPNYIWYKTNLTFYELDFKPDVDGMNFDIRSSWFEQDENELLYWVKDNRLDEFESYLEFSHVSLWQKHAEIESVALRITSDELLESITLLVDTSEGELRCNH